MFPQVIGLLQSGEAVIEGRTTPRWLIQPALLEAVFDVIRRNSRDKIVYQHHFTRPIGFCPLVQTKDDDRIKFHQVNGAEGPTRFVENRSAMETCVLSVALVAVDSGIESPTRAYSLVNAFVGALPEFPEPWDIFSLTSMPNFTYAEARKLSREWWGGPTGIGHALVWGTVN